MQDSKSGEPADSARYFIAVPEWVAVAKLSPQALAAYVILLGHVNRKRGDNLAWPSMETIAELTGYSRRQSVSPYLNELVALEIVQVRVEKTPKGRKNYYTVTKQPPAWWASPRSIVEFHKARKSVDEVDLEMEAEVEPEAEPEGGSCAPPHDPSCATPHQIETNATTRRKPSHSRGGSTASPESSHSRGGPLASSTGRDAKPQAISLDPPADYFDPEAWTDGQVQRWLVSASTAAMKAAGKPIATGARDRIGSGVKTAMKSGLDRTRLLDELARELNRAVAGAADRAWIVDPANVRPPRPNLDELMREIDPDAPEEALIEHLYDEVGDVGVDATVYSMAETHHPNAIANTLRKRSA